MADTYYNSHKEIHYSISEILPTYLYGFGFCECVIGIIDSLFHFLPNLFLKEYINLKGRNAKVLSIWVSKNDYIPEVVFCKNSQKFCWIRGTEKLFHATGHFTKCSPMVPNLYTWIVLLVISLDFKSHTVGPKILCPIIIGFLVSVVLPWIIRSFTILMWSRYSLKIARMFLKF